MKIATVLAGVLYSCTALLAQEPIATVPFKWVMNQIILTVDVDRHGTMNFQLDTGADPSLVDLATARNLNLITRPVRHAPGYDGGSSAMDYIAPLHDLRLGDLYVDSLYAMTVDLGMASRYIGLPLQGVLGFSFLQNRIVQIDYKRRVIRFYDTSPAVDPGRNGATVPMMLIEGESTPIIRDLTLDGIPLSAGIDTGSSYSFLLFPNTVASLGLDSDAPHIRADSVLHGEREETDILRGHRADMQIEGMHFKSVGVEFTRSGWSGAGTELWDGTLGNAFFRNMRLTLDYRNGLISIER